LKRGRRVPAPGSSLPLSVAPSLPPVPSADIVDTSAVSMASPSALRKFSLEWGQQLLRSAFQGHLLPPSSDPSLQLHQFLDVDRFVCSSTSLTYQCPCGASKKLDRARDLKEHFNSKKHVQGTVMRSRVSAVLSVC
jgi:hypothetical protein